MQIKTDLHKHRSYKKTCFVIPPAKNVQVMTGKYQAKAGLTVVFKCFIFLVVGFDFPKPCFNNTFQHTQKSFKRNIDGVGVVNFIGLTILNQLTSESVFYKWLCFRSLSNLNKVYR